MWAHFRKGLPRSANGSFSTVGADSGIGHKGAGSLPVDSLLADHDMTFRAGLPDNLPAATAFDGLVLPPAAGAPDEDRMG